MTHRHVHRRLIIEELEPRVAPAGLYSVGAAAISPDWFAQVDPSYVSPSTNGAGSALESVGGATGPPAPQAGTNDWIVQLSSASLAGIHSVSEAAGLLDNQSAGIDVVSGLGMAGQLLVHSTSSDPNSVAQWLSSNPAIAYFEPDFLIHVNTIPNDPSFSQLWGLNNTGQTGGTPGADISATDAWNVTTGSSSVVVGVVDTGVDYNHPDLAANIWTNPGEIAGNGIDDDHNGFMDDVHGYNFVNNTGNPMDDNNHGTHVSGTIAAAGNNGVGVAGINWTSSIMALKFLDSSGSGSTSNAVRAINYATLMRNTYGVNVRVLNNSWGGGSSTSLKNAITATGNAGILFVVAAGNDGTNNDTTASYPASYHLSNMIVVAATDKNDALASFSNYGAAKVDLGAPGVSIYSTTRNNTYSTFSGTSMATPHVTGVAALAWAANSSATMQQVRSAILNGVDSVSSLAGKTVTGGRLNAAHTLSLIGGGGTGGGPVVSITATDANASETGPDPGVFTVSRTGATTAALTVGYAIAGTASNGSDYDTLSGSVTIPAGASSAAITVTPIDDTLVEGSETVVLNLSSSAAYGLGSPASATVAIADNDGPTYYTYTSADVPKAIPDLTTIISTLNVPDSLDISDLNVTLDIAHTYDSDLTASLIAPDGTAVPLFSRVGGSGDNFTSTVLDDQAATAISSGTAPFTGTYRPSGSLASLNGKNTLGVWTLQVSDTAALDTGTLQGWTISVAGGSAPPPLPTVTIVAADPNAAEQNRDPGVFTVSRTGSTASALSVAYAAGGTALNGTDYDALSGTLTIPAGAASAAITVTPVDDTLVEGTESVLLSLSPNAAYTVAAPGSATVTIADNDSAPTTTYTYVSSNVPKPIPDLTAITSTLTVPDSFTLNDLNVRLNISHTWDSDLSAYLIAPDGTRVQLFSGVGSNGDNFTNTTLDDQAAASITSGRAPFSGTYRPQAALAALNGKNVLGTWTLQVSDTSRRDTGTLNSWAIIATSSAGTLGTISTADPTQIPIAAGQRETFTDADGSLVTVMLAGQGSGYFTLTNGDTTGAAIADIVLNGTTPRTTLSIRSTGGTVPGTTFEGLTAGSALGGLNAGKTGLSSGGQISMAGSVRTITLGDIGDNAVISVQGLMGGFSAGAIGANLHLNVTSDLGMFKADTVGAGAKISAGGAIGSVRTIQGDLAADIAAGLGIGTISVAHGNLAGTIAAAGGLGIFSICAPNGSLSATIRTPGTVGRIQAQSVVNTTVSAGSIGMVHVVQDLNGSLLLAGYDIGADMTFGTSDDGAFASPAPTASRMRPPLSRGPSGNIGSVRVGGNMSATSISAGISPGPDLMFGTADDVVVSSSLQGAIASITVGGSLTGSTNSAESFGIVAHGALRTLQVGTTRYQPPWPVFGNLVIKDNIA